MIEFLHNSVEMAHLCVNQTFHSQMITVTYSCECVHMCTETRMSRNLLQMCLVHLQKDLKNKHAWQEEDEAAGKGGMKSIGCVETEAKMPWAKIKVEGKIQMLKNNG